MSYRYCPACDAGLPEPTIREDLEDWATCHHCGAELPRAKTLEEWVIELSDRVLELEMLRDS